MRQALTATLALPALLALLGGPVLVLAQQPWGLGPYGPPGGQFRPLEPSNARGVPPAKLPAEEPSKTSPGTQSAAPTAPAAPAPASSPPGVSTASPSPMGAPGWPMAPPPGAQPFPMPQMPQAAAPYGYPATPPAYPMGMGGSPPGWGLPGPGAYSPFGPPPTGQPPAAPATSPAPTAPTWGQPPAMAPMGPQPPASPWGQPPGAPAMGQAPAAASMGPQSATSPWSQPPGAMSMGPQTAAPPWSQPPTASSMGPQPPASPWGQPPGAASMGPQSGISPWGPQQPATSSTRAPRVELELNQRQPYVQENVLLHLRVVSDQNLVTATPELSSANDLIIQKLEGPKASFRANPDGRREILTEFVYVLTPLRAGNLSLPALRVTGETAGDAYGFGRQRFDVSGGEGTQLQVRPALASVQPWLPLEDLRLTASLDGGEEVKSGQPQSLTLELDAIGATGSQLPSLEASLVSPDYRVYREQTQTEAKVSPNGQRLEGKRVEHYTLVPRDGGRVRLPSIRIPWWNVRTSSREWASLAGTLGRGGMADKEASLFFSEGSAPLWLGLSVLLLPILGFGIGLRYRGQVLAPEPGERHTLGARLGRGARSAADATGRGLARVRDRLHPAPALRALHQAFLGLLPASSRFLGCLSAANQERDPAVWARRFQHQACRYLPVEAKAPQPGSLPRLAGQVLLLRPGADPDQLLRLLRQLDGALYGGQDIDFPRWKREFSREVGRTKGLFRRRARRSHIERPRLPELNPRPV